MRRCELFACHAFFAFWHAGCAVAVMTVNLQTRPKRAQRRLKLGPARFGGEAKAGSLPATSTGVPQAPASFEAFARVRFQQAGTSLGKAWNGCKRLWSRQDWFAGIKPLPRETVSAVAAVTIPVSLVLFSLIHADTLKQQSRERPLLSAGEHPAPHLPGVEPERAPVPKPATPGAARLLLQRQDFPNRARLLSSALAVKDSISAGSCRTAGPTASRPRTTGGAARSGPVLTVCG